MTQPAFTMTPDAHAAYLARTNETAFWGVTTRVVRRCPDSVNKERTLVSWSYLPQAVPRNFSWAVRSGRKVPFCWASPLQS